jgi:large subunit ribosomal protein L35
VGLYFPTRQDKDVVEAPKGFVMPKLKTHKGVAKRVRLTKKGKVKRSQAWHAHLMAGKRPSRRRRLKRSTIMFGAEAKRMKRLLGLA